MPDDRLAALERGMQILAQVLRSKAEKNRAEIPDHKHHGYQMLAEYASGYAQAAEEAATAIEAALSSTAPVPCPECGGTPGCDRSIVRSASLPPDGEPRVDDDTEVIPCPRCSAQPAPSDVVVPRDVAEEYVEASASVTNPIGDEEELGRISDRYYAAQEALEAVLAAALRQGGG